ncbi:hypothetical protein CcaverHIS002_0601730 [Cutaneotrichosporon cavernicola]|nr:hypothetical protein CcaverHIS002_0601730 [Cutaneotrichosporon cavernicola]BEJ00328.1 hypothetical protein CcaverHIS631_0501850 [Cutaneotrichosporon cavernicola]BEJ08098.1 hypothetical protein CcaverHIS641_0501830 [Cutaneotrichosporon cavernicola]
MSTSASTSMPKWYKPEPSVEEPVLRVFNSLTRSKDVFIPSRGRQVDWYNCGPTVYDATHMGHARNYLTQDIVRRILRDYFNYDVNFVMNITDIDDKIIMRAREGYLLDETIQQNPKLSPELVTEAREAFAQYLPKLVKNLPSPVESGSNDALTQFGAIEKKAASDAAFVAAGTEKEEKFALYIASLGKARDAIVAAEKGQGSTKDLVDGTADVLGPYLGASKGASIPNLVDVSRALASKWEKSFFDDMKRLRVLSPDLVTRVSEYVPEIVTFIQKIIDNGFAYESEGNVWFNVDKFEGAEGDGFRHEYAKLQPSAKGNRKLLDEGEGALTGSRGKQSSADFALWKAYKPGEPAWPSPWGEGRPGWHIECSVMASAVLGDGMDIHSGGVDLMFPHHDNELAQSEAALGCKQWVNYFLHTGHLHIEGLKMSKSLKNFISIDEALRDYSARQLRLAFMLQTWNSRMDFRRDLVLDVKTKEESFDKFFANVKARISETAARFGDGDDSDGKHHFDELEKKLFADFHKAQYDFRVALCDSFNTSQAINVLLDLVSAVNVYFRARGADYNIQPIRTIAQWITRMLNMFGLGEGPAVASASAIGWGKEGDSGAGADLEAQLDKYIRALASFRDDVRRLAIQGKDNAALSKDILTLCDTFRDDDLVELGVQLEDGQGKDGAALYKLVDPSVLRAAREEKAKAAADKIAKKEAARKAEEAKRLAQLEKGRVSPVDMFKPPNVAEGTWTKWDEAGVPTHDGQGVEVSKGQSKKFAKERKVQEKLHEAFNAWQKEQA